MHVHIDLETASEVDLRKCGSHVYAEHPSTRIVCASWRVNDNAILRWRADKPELGLDEMLNRLRNADRIIAHNAGFERTLMTWPGSPGVRMSWDVPRDLSRWDCTAARSAAIGLPRSLDGASSAFGLDVTKDKEGKKLMLFMCKPRVRTGPGTGKLSDWSHHTDPNITRLCDYCDQDVVVECNLDAVLPQLSPDERRCWEATERMNDRGIAVDEDLLLRVAFLIDDATRALNARISQATGGAVSRVTNHEALARWLIAQGIDLGDEPSVSKSAITAILEGLDGEDLSMMTEDERRHQELVRQVLMMRREGGKSSAAKYRAILNRVTRDGRLHGASIYCGAAMTGRWSSVGAQLQNLPRGGAIDDIMGLIDAILTDMPLDMIEMLYGPGLICASELLRPVFVSGQDTMEGVSEDDPLLA